MCKQAINDNGKSQMGMRYLLDTNICVRYLNSRSTVVRDRLRSLISLANNLISLVSLFIRAPDLGFLKPLCSKAQFFVFDPARKIRDTNLISVAHNTLEVERVDELKLEDWEVEI